MMILDSNLDPALRRTDYAPVITRVIGGSGELAMDCDPGDYGDSLLDHDLQAETLGAVSGDFHCEAYPDVESMLELVGGKLGFTAADLRGYRLQEKYTAPMYRTGVWLRLPPANS